jgi:hypothetical protein
MTAAIVHRTHVCDDPACKDYRGEKRDGRVVVFCHACGKKLECDAEAT